MPAAQWLAPFLPAASVFLAELIASPNATLALTESDNLEDTPLTDETSETEDAAGADRSTDLRFRKRQSCASNYFPCAARGYCCAANTVCQTDQLGQVACCPQGAACTGVVPSSSATAAAGTSTVAGGSTLAAATTTNGATIGGNGGQIVAGGSTVAFIAGTSGAERRTGGMLGWVMGIVGFGTGAAMIVL